MVKPFLPLVFLFFIGCKDKDLPIISSAKVITSVSFKKSDNPGLPGDIVGKVLTDSIKFEIPLHIPINSLVPTIDFSGKSIAPANRTAQDFTNDIIYQITAEDGSAQSYIFRVARTLSDTASLILGTWKLIKDSVINENWINPAGGYLLPGVYLGTALDYYTFETNGMLSARTNNVSGSNAYRITEDKKLDVPVWTVQYGLGTIEVLSNSNFTFYFSASSSNGGRYYRKVYLKR